MQLYLFIFLKYEKNCKECYRIPLQRINQHQFQKSLKAVSKPDLTILTKSSGFVRIQDACGFESGSNLVKKSSVPEKFRLLNFGFLPSLAPKSRGSVCLLKRNRPHAVVNIGASLTPGFRTPQFFSLQNDQQEPTRRTLQFTVFS